MLSKKKRFSTSVLCGKQKPWA
uniref:Uncharacterized protein n=1 Tax=Anguilla anguilla TaxID=7936 RepID=A0A0E9UGA1_ANGAN